MTSAIDSVVAFLDLQNVILENIWIDERQKKNWRNVEVVTAWKYACNTRIRKLIQSKSASEETLDDLIIECQYQMEKTEELRNKMKYIKPEIAPLTTLDFLI